MKNTAKHFLLIAPLLGLFTASCGDNFSKPQDAGPSCLYGGKRYTLWQQWKAKDGCNVCVCGLESEALCSKDMICGDGGTSDLARPADATSDRSNLSDVLISASDAVVDKAQDAAKADVPVSDGRIVDAPVSDGRIVDAPADRPDSDGRLASERD